MVSGLLRVLIADDDPLVRSDLRAQLGNLGHLVIAEAVDGRQAVTLARRVRPDLVVMDIEMPEMDGLEATAAIRDREGTTGEHMPIIAMTAHAIKGFRERCTEAGMDGYISKPIQPAELYEALESVRSSAAAMQEVSN